MLVVLLTAAALGSPDRAGPPAHADANTSGPASAVRTPQLLASFLPLRTPVGSWAEYSVRSRGDPGVRVRFAVIAPQLEDGRAWIEVTALGELALPFAARVLVRSGHGVERAVLYVLGQAPLELPIEPSGNAARGARRGRAPPRIFTAGRKDVSVPAGRFDAEQVRIGTGVRAWRSKRVPLWGLVRAEGPRQLIELVAYGQSGARSVFPYAQGNGSETAK